MAKTPAPRKFVVTMADGSTKKVKAHRMERDGSGTRLFDEDGEMVVNWNDGEVRSCIREDLIEE